MVEVLETHGWVANACARMDEPARMISLAVSQDNTAMDIKACLGVLIKERFLAARHVGVPPPLLVVVIDASQLSRRASRKICHVTSLKRLVCFGISAFQVYLYVCTLFLLYKVRNEC